MRFPRTDGKLLIRPAPGYTPHIGVLVDTMQRCRETTSALVQDLTVEQLDYLFDDEDNSIGALLLHLGSLEVGYQEITFFGRNILNNPERLPKWEVAMDLGAPARAQIRGRPASYYLAELEAVRQETLELFRQRDDQWLWEIGPISDNCNNHYLWYHVFEDEINHRGEMHWRLSRMQLAG